MELAELVSSAAIQLPSLSVGYELFSVSASIFDCYSSWCLNSCNILLLWSDLSCVSHCTGNPVSVGLQQVVSVSGSFLQNCAVCLPSSFSLSPQIPFVLAADSHISKEHRCFFYIRVSLKCGKLCSFNVLLMYRLSISSLKHLESQLKSGFSIFLME